MTVEPGDEAHRARADAKPVNGSDGRARADGGPADGADDRARADAGRPDGGPRPPLARLLAAGAKTGDRFAHATGIDRALDDAVEEAIVRALRSPGVERAIARVVQRNAFQDALADSLVSDEVAAAIIEALESEAADQVWAEILASPKAQMLVERIAEAPEVRAAITQQGAGLLTDIGARLTVVTEALDDTLERVVSSAHHDAETDQAGLVTRVVAAAVDVGIAAVLYSISASVIASVIPFATGAQLSLWLLILLILLGASVAGGVVVAFWALAGQTPGMRFLSIRLEHDGRREIGFRPAVRRLLAIPVALLPAGLGFLAILRDPERRGWHDRIAGTEVVYDTTRRVAPHSKRRAEGETAQQRAR